MANDIVIISKVGDKLFLPFVPGSFDQQFINYPIRRRNTAPTVWCLCLNLL